MVRLKIVSAILTKIHWPVDPDWSMVVACEGLKAPPIWVNSS